MADGCDVHGQHIPKPLRIVPHHIQPLAMGGPDTSENRVNVCDTGHFSIHRLLDDLLHTGFLRKRGGTRRERTLALQGYGSWINAGKPGHPVYELHEETP